jgi:hypothetical protein
LPLPNLDCAVDEALGAAPGGALCCSLGLPNHESLRELGNGYSEGASRRNLAKRTQRVHGGNEKGTSPSVARAPALPPVPRIPGPASRPARPVTENDIADHARCCDVAVLLGAAVAPRAGAHCSQRPGTAHSDPQQVHPCHLHDRGEPGARRGKWPGLVQTNAAEQTQTCTAAATGPIDRSPPEFDELRRASAVGSKSQPPRPQMATPQRCRQV